MSIESSHDLVVRLREMDEHYARLEPARGAETRLLARLEKATPSSRKPVGLTWRTIWRPLVFVGACVAVLAISLHDEIPRARRAYFRPLQSNVPAASTEVRPPAPKTPRNQDSVFHDAIVPTARPTNDNRHDVAPSFPLFQNMPSTAEDFVDPSQPRSDRMPRVPLSYRSSPFDGPKKMFSSDTSPEWYWSGPAAPKSDFPLSGWGGSSSTSSPSSRSHEKPKAPEPKASAVCQPPDFFKKSADLDCSEKGLMLTEITLLNPCGNGLFRHEKHECVETELEACFMATLGDGKTCQDPGNFKLIAYEKCTAAGQQLTDLVYDFDNCNGMVKMAQFTCCTPAVEPPPPNPPSCYKLAPIDYSTCKDIGMMKQEASDLCMAEKGYLFDMQYAGDCPAGQASQLFVACCDY